MSKRFILISVVFIVLCWGLFAISLRGTEKSKNTNEKHLVATVGFIYPFILLYFLYVFAHVTCTFKNVDTKTEEVVQTYELVSLSNVKEIDSRFFTSLFGGTGYIENNSKMYFYIKKNNEYSLQDANYEDCRFIYTSKKPYMEVVEQLDAVLVKCKNSKVANFLGLDFEGENIDKKV